MMKPLPPYVILKMNGTYQETETKGGLLIPQSARDPRAEGNVVDVGSAWKEKKGRKWITHQHQLQKGHRVLIPYYSGTSMTTEAGHFIVIREDEVLATIEKDT